MEEALWEVVSLGKLSDQTGLTPIRRTTDIFESSDKTVGMKSLWESCSTEEVCSSLGGSERLLMELRERLKDWLALQPHLPQGISERRLEYFIIASKLSLEQAKQKLDMYYTARRHVPELLANRDPRGVGISTMHKTAQWVTLSKMTPEKYRISIARLINDDASKFNPWEFYKYTFMVGEVRISEERSLGEVFIYDVSRLTLAHMVKMTPAMLEKCIVLATKMYGTRIKAIHLLYPPAYIDTLLSIAKSILKPKLVSRIHLHSSIESLHKLVPKSLLPSDYDGEQPSMNELTDMMCAKLEEWREWFLEQQAIMVDESRRPGPAVDGDALFGFSGSFRKLDVD